MAIKYVKYAGDFETTTDPADVRVWASCLVNIENFKTDFIGNDIHSFMEFLQNKNSVVYFHNLKFDGEFIISYLLNHGFTYSDKPQPRTFSTLITDTGIYYSITVIFEKKNKKYKKVTFYDSMKKLPFKVAQISKAFKLKDEKLTIDYNAPRPVGHQLTPEEIAYIVNDCRIVAQALHIQFNQGLKRMTNASDAMSNYKSIVGASNFKTWFPVLPLELDADIRRAYKGGFTWLNPKYRHRSVKSGLVFDVNSLYPWAMRTQLLPFGYPTFFEGEPSTDEEWPLFIVRCHAAFKLKRGHIPTIQLKNNPRYVQTEYLENSGYDPVTGDLEITPMTLTNVDLDLFLEHYDIEFLEYECGWRFHGAYGMFNEYIDYWMNVKETSEGPIRQLAKLMLNSLYGRFALNPRAINKVPALDPEGVVDYVVIDTAEKAHLFNAKEPEPREPVYTAMGCFITAYAREKTIRTAQSMYDRIIYCDTDSCHVEGYQLPEIEIHPTKLGAWAHEGTFYNSVFIRSKTYMESHMEPMKASLKQYASALNAVNLADICREGKTVSIPDTLRNYSRMMSISTDITRHNGSILSTYTKVTCAGMPDNVKENVTYDNFVPGAVFSGKLVPVRYPGGVVLVDRTFTIN